MQKDDAEPVTEGCPRSLEKIAAVLERRGIEFTTIKDASGDLRRQNEYQVHMGNDRGTRCCCGQQAREQPAQFGLSEPYGFACDATMLRSVGSRHTL